MSLVLYPLEWSCILRSITTFPSLELDTNIIKRVRNKMLESKLLLIISLWIFKQKTFKKNNHGYTCEPQILFKLRFILHFHDRIPSYGQILYFRRTVEGKEVFWPNVLAQSAQPQILIVSHLPPQHAHMDKNKQPCIRICTVWWQATEMLQPAVELTWGED